MVISMWCCSSLSGRRDSDVQWTGSAAASYSGLGNQIEEPSLAGQLNCHCRMSLVENKLKLRRILFCYIFLTGSTESTFNNFCQPPFYAYFGHVYLDANWKEIPNVFSW